MLAYPSTVPLDALICAVMAAVTVLGKTLDIKPHLESPNVLPLFHSLAAAVVYV